MDRLPADHDESRLMRRPGRPRQRTRDRLSVRKTAAHLVLVLALPTLGFATIVPAAADDSTPAVASELAFTITDPRITESSGLARDSRNMVFWTTNDSGDSGIVYAVDPTGRTRGTLEFDAEPVDVEALAYANGNLYVADIGDNTRTRESIRIYVFNNPRPNQDRGDYYTAYDFVYPDRAHDAEAIVVDDGRIYIITKGSPGVIYRAPRQLSAGSDNLLTRVGDAPAYVTDATVLPSGEYAVRTYVSVEVLEPQLYAPVARAALPFQQQGESMTVSLSDDALLVGSEGPASPVLRVPIPTELAAAPPGALNPPPSPVPTATAEVQGGTNRTGTLIALGLALLVSIGAGLVVFFRDRSNDMPFRPDPTPRRLIDAVTPGGVTRESDAPDASAADEDGDRTVIRRPSGGAGSAKTGGGYRREVWDLPIPDDDGPTEIRRR